jgi:hypothetical protein
LECDYDVLPTELYKLLEYKQWNKMVHRFEAEELCENDEDDDEQQQQGRSLLTFQCRVWIVRKESNGKLKWRILPLHAAMIFQAPVEVVEYILEAFPYAAQCKDDRGMLPLHLAFRNILECCSSNNNNNNKSSTSSLTTTTTLEIIEELLTAYPEAIWTRDRKGRTPLEGSLLVATNNNNNKIFLQVLQLYSNIVAAAEKKQHQPPPSSPQKPPQCPILTAATKQVAVLEELRNSFRKQQTEIITKHEQEKQELLQQLEQAQQQIQILKQRQQETSSSRSHNESHNHTSSSSRTTTTTPSLDSGDAASFANGKETKKGDHHHHDLDDNEEEVSALRAQNQQLVSLLQDILHQDSWIVQQWQRENEEHQQRLSHILQTSIDPPSNTSKIPPVKLVPSSSSTSANSFEDTDLD